jgi:hypothetical protein
MKWNYTNKDIDVYIIYNVYSFKNITLFEAELFSTIKHFETLINIWG